jgi:hypothetical protein
VLIDVVDVYVAAKLWLTRVSVNAAATKQIDMTNLIFLFIIKVTEYGS